MLYLRLHLLFVCHACLFARFPEYAGTLADAEYVKDQGHASITHDRRTSVQGKPFNCFPSGLTTISWVSLMPSTTNPNCRSSPAGQPC